MSCQCMREPDPGCCEDSKCPLSSGHCRCCDDCTQHVATSLPAPVPVGSSVPGNTPTAGEHKPQKWYTECDCVHPDDDPATEELPEADYALLVDDFEDAHTNLYEDGDGDLMGRGCEKSYTDTRCAVCSIGGDYPDVPWPCPTAAAEGAES